MQITLHVRGLDSTLARVRNAPRQVQYAMTLAVNEAAKKVQEHTVTKLLPEKFTLRSRGAPWWRPKTRFGFNIRFARRSQKEPQAVVGSRAEWLPLQEAGGIKNLGEKSIAVPIVGGARPAPSAVIPRRLKPRRLLQAKRTFVVEGAKGKLVLGRKGKARYPVRVWYAFESEATIKPVLTFGSTETRVAVSALGPAFHLALRRALATAR